MARKQSVGVCFFCGQGFAKGGMSKHLAICPERTKANAGADAGQEETLYHLRVTDAY